jgi:hypothetical protein
MSEEPPWLSLTEAAQMSGLSREAVRGRARRNLIPSRRGNDGSVLVQLPTTLVTTPDQGESGSLSMLVSDLQAEVADLRVALARAESGAEAARAIALAEVAAANDQTHARDALIEELRAELAEARKSALVRLIEALRRRPKGQGDG